MPNATISTVAGSTKSQGMRSGRRVVGEVVDVVTGMMNNGQSGNGVNSYLPISRLLYLLGYTFGARLLTYSS